MTLVKICGLKRTEDILAINELRPDYAGFVFAASKRQVSNSEARRLKAILAPDIKAVGVFVDAPEGEIVNAVKEGTIDIVQLHGSENTAYIQSLREKTGATIIKAVRVRNTQDILAAAALPADYLLLDTYIRGEMGGGGIAFDWKLIPPGMKPYFLAGGLDAANVAAAIKRHTPYCVDVSSKVEKDGYKDYKKMAAFIRAVRKEQ